MSGVWNKEYKTMRVTITVVHKATGETAMVCLPTSMKEAQKEIRSLRKVHPRDEYTIILQGPHQALLEV